MSFSNAFLKKTDPNDPKGLEELKGKTIVDIGFVDEKIEGGLTIDYEDGDKIKRIVLGFTDLGMWTAWQGEKGKDNPEDVLKEKINKIRDSDIWDSFSLVDDPLNRCYKFMTKSKEVFRLNISEIKLLPENIKKYFQVQGKERIRLIEENETFNKVDHNSLTDEEKVGECIWSDLVFWA